MTRCLIQWMPQFCYKRSSNVVLSVFFYYNHCEESHHFFGIFPQFPLNGCLLTWLQNTAQKIGSKVHHLTGSFDWLCLFFYLISTRKWTLINSFWQRVKRLIIFPLIGSTLRTKLLILLSRTGHWNVGTYNSDHNFFKNFQPSMINGTHQQFSFCQFISFQQFFIGELFQNSWRHTWPSCCVVCGRHYKCLLFFVTLWSTAWYL
jgi:hypothetical protein